MRIKEAARRTGLTEKTIRYYENRGLVLPDTEERNGRTWRDYTEDHIRLLEAVAGWRRPTRPGAGCAASGSAGKCTTRRTC